MEIVERGTGIPLVLVPGIQGRWEFMRPAVDALARAFRVITFPLCGERASGLSYDPARGLANFADQINGALDHVSVERAVICGVSFGGLAALRFAATSPARTEALVLASTPGPGWALRRRHEWYTRVPWLFGPVFVAEAPLRLRKEVAIAFPHPRQRLRFAGQQLRALVTAPISFRQMAERARSIGASDLVSDCERVTAPTLVVTGEPGLDHVVPVEGSSAYASLIRGARGAVLERTGHLGSVTQPERFTAIVEQFVRSIRNAGAAA